MAWWPGTVSSTGWHWVTKPEVSAEMVAMKVMVVRVTALRVPGLPTLKVPLAVAAAGLFGVPGWCLADEVPKSAHSQGLAQVIILLQVWTQWGLLQGHPDLQAHRASPKDPNSTLTLGVRE